MNETLPWFERNLIFGQPKEMLPFYLDRLEGTIVRIQEKVKNISDSTLSEKLNGKWSVKQQIGHLAEVDEIANKRLDEMVAGITPMSPAVFEPHDYNPWPIEKVIDLFKTNRHKNLKKYQSLSDADLLKPSMHPRLKVMMTPVDLAWFDAEHDDHHLVKINGILYELAQRS
jgi:uncharacterized damage-inducible protein DinB